MQPSEWFTVCIINNMFQLGVERIRSATCLRRADSEPHRSIVTTMCLKTAFKVSFIKQLLQIVLWIEIQRTDTQKLFQSSGFSQTIGACWCNLHYI